MVLMFVDFRKAICFSEGHLLHYLQVWFPSHRLKLAITDAFKDSHRSEYARNCPKKYIIFSNEERYAGAYSSDKPLSKGFQYENTNDCLVLDGSNINLNTWSHTIITFES